VVSTGLLLLGLRIIVGLLLVGFLSAVFVVLWRDYRAAAGAVSQGARRLGRLVVIHSEDNGVAPVGTVYPLLPLTSLGRGPANTIVLPDSFCSQEHAVVSWRSGQWWLEDRRSSNGTQLNGDPVEEPVVVSSGDVIGVGRVQLKLELD
jgi:hypothetical protein